MKKIIIACVLTCVLAFGAKVDAAKLTHLNAYGAQGTIQSEAQLPNEDNWIELDSQTNVKLNKVWNLNFDKSFKASKIKSAVIVKDGALIPVTVSKSKSTQLQIKATYQFQPNSDFELRVSLANGKNYKMKFSTVDGVRAADIEPNYDLQIASPLYVGEKIRGSFSESDVMDNYSFTLQKASNIQFAVQTTEADRYTIVKLFDTNGKNIYEEYYVGNFNFQQQLPKGRYYLSLSQSGFKNNYELKLTDRIITLTESEKGRLSQLQTAWDNWKPVHTGPLSTGVSLKPPYNAGVVHPAAALDGLNTTKMARFIAGLGTDINLNDEYSKRIQAGSLVQALNGQMTHYPTKPAGISEDLYELGYKGTSSSNLWMINEKSSFSYSVIDGYLTDFGASNDLALGHRRWILSPAMNEIGFGFAGGYTGMYVVEDGYPSQFEDYDEILWPAAGVMPLEFFRDNTKWSITFSDDKYFVKSIENVEIKVTYNDQTRVIKMGEGNFMSLGLQGYGYQNQVIIFDPSFITSYTHGDRVKIEVSGIYTADKQLTTLKYETIFLQIEQ